MKKYIRDVRASSDFYDASGTFKMYMVHGPNRLYFLWSDLPERDVKSQLKNDETMEVCEPEDAFSVRYGHQPIYELYTGDDRISGLPYIARAVVDRQQFKIDNNINASRRPAPKSVKAAEIRYTRPDGKDSVVNTDNGNYEYVIKEIEDVMGHDFAYSVRELFEESEAQGEYFKEFIKDSFDDYIAGVSDSINEAIDKAVDLRKAIDDMEDTDDRMVSLISDVIDSISSINSEVDNFIDNINGAYEDGDY